MRSLHILSGLIDMLPAIRLNDKFRLEADEINDERTDDFLPPEFESGHPPVS
jgi:hypothetical protein